jgi:nitric oxide reductase activation protein
MVSNLEVQVSIRGTWGDKPYICIAYDSRLEKFEKVKRLFPALQANGTTPEGLCYQAIMKHFVESNKDMDSYLLNICDGEPTFSNQQCTYGGENAVLHTKKMVNQIREMGINVMAYFVGSDYGRGESSSQAKFKKMYGSDSRFIDVTQVVPITKTLNELFLKK